MSDTVASDLLSVLSVEKSSMSFSNSFSMAENFFIQTLVSEEWSFARELACSASKFEK